MLKPPPPYQLRELAVDDIAEVLAIEEQSLPRARKASLYRYELAQNQLAHYQALTRSEEDGSERLLGYAGYWLMGDEVHISMIAVEPACRSHGLGELLLLNMLCSALQHEARLVTLEVRQSNWAAQELYRKYHFDEVGRRRRYYRDTGEDALLMTIEFETSPRYASFLSDRKEALYKRLGAGT